MTDSMLPLRPHDEMNPNKMREVAEWSKNKDAQQEFQKNFRELIETKPLYSTVDTVLPPGRIQFVLDVARVYCKNANCRMEQPFRPREYQSWYHFNDRNLRFSEKQILRNYDLLMNGMYPLEIECQECKAETYYYFVFVDVKNGRISKFGQIPHWEPKLDREVTKELGAGYGFYSKALRNLAENYGIGACAYFRRMLEDYIGPLLRLLHEFKKEEGAGDEELQAINDVIASKNFSKKTEYAAQICPPALIIGGVNPLKELHDLLSYNIHAGSDKDAAEVALKIRGIIEYVVVRLRKHHDAQKQFLDAMKKTRSESPPRNNSA
jgi:hypothetical protein